MDNCTSPLRTVGSWWLRVGVGSTVYTRVGCHTVIAAYRR